MDCKPFIVIFAIFFAIVLPCSALNVVSTTSVLWDPVQSIGGSNVKVIYLADPAVCPHVQGDIIPNRIQIEKEFISSADLFVAHNSSVDRQYVMPFVDDFMNANGYTKPEWVTLNNPDMTWNTPENAKNLATEVKDWLIQADPENTDYYNKMHESYIARIDEAGKMTPEEKDLIPGQKAISMLWQKNAAENWLGLDVVDYYAPDFYMGGKYSATKMVDRINENPKSYEDVLYVIENMQSGELGKGIEESLKDKGFEVKRVIFTNFPNSIDGVDSIPAVLEYNKNLVIPNDKVEVLENTDSDLPKPTKSPGFGIITIFASACVILFGRKIFS
ncbi:zinc ABC transporter substrate-binding protein [Methanoplanus sp. FWC-SCC4]|uniref:Zinc ABC transporter substrate-binding protein n=1 Tax=Methanochimaera problematica TaxID=2609417 RepID=A0AA97I2C5_9EURY|nr:metal ABC transporter substrate-binding protein [Methanoplanus sp. FWC-SCC4]WOF16125.1 zinc ABC transporter substrate-binding protein [Methanoplanus sp. FWC-SCC4]